MPVNSFLLILGAAVVILLFIIFLFKKPKKKQQTIEKVTYNHRIKRNNKTIDVNITVINKSNFAINNISTELLIPENLSASDSDLTKHIDILDEKKSVEFSYTLKAKKIVSGHLTGTISYTNNEKEEKTIEIKPIFIGIITPFVEKLKMQRDKFNKRLSTIFQKKTDFKFNGSIEIVQERIDALLENMYYIEKSVSSDGSTFTGLYAAKEIGSERFIGAYILFDSVMNQFYIQLYSDDESLIESLQVELFDTFSSL